MLILYFSIAGIASCKKIKSFAVPLANLALSFAIVNPATEKTLSEGADVAEMQSILGAKVDNNLYYLVLNCHDARLTHGDPLTLHENQHVCGAEVNSNLHAGLFSSSLTCVSSAPRPRNFSSMVA